MDKNLVRDRVVCCVLAMGGGSLRRILDKFFLLGGGRGGGVSLLVPYTGMYTVNQRTWRVSVVSHLDRAWGCEGLPSSCDAVPCVVVNQVRERWERLL